MSEGAVLQRLTSVALIVGGILTVVAIAIFPQAKDPSNLLSHVVAYSDKETLAQLGVLSRTVGVWALVLGFANVHHFIGQGAGAAWARLGFYGLVIGAAGLTAAGGLAYGAIQAAVSWSIAPADPTFSVAGGLVIGSLNAFNLSVVAFWAALVFVGIAWTRTDIYPQWASWPLLILGIVGAVMGLARLFVDTTSTFELVFSFSAGLTGIWAVVVGIWLARRSWR